METIQEKTNRQHNEYSNEEKKTIKNARNYIAATYDFFRAVESGEISTIEEIKAEIREMKTDFKEKLQFTSIFPDVDEWEING